MSISILSNEKLIELYCAAKKHKVSEEFIRLIEVEMFNRHIRVDRLD
jgi:hypothetical protein